MAFATSFKKGTSQVHLSNSPRVVHGLNLVRVWSAFNVWLAAVKLYPSAPPALSGLEAMPVPNFYEEAAEGEDFHTFRVS